jgi:subtilisin family serine protease
MFDTGAPITEARVVDYTSEAALVRTAEARLRGVGFEVLQVSSTTINIAGPPERYEEVFGTTLVTEEREVIKPGARQDTATFVDTPDTDVSGLIDTSRSPLADVLEGVAIEEPRYFMAAVADAFAPLRAYWHLRVPGDVSLGCNADRAHRRATTGRRVRVAMTDSGWFAHPYFTERGYRVRPTVLGPGAQDAASDDDGHGTAESANVFATAPDVDFTMVKMSFVNSTAAFNAAVDLAPHVITNSWGSSVVRGPLSAADQALAAAIAAAVASGIIVVFAAGNGHHGFPGQHPDVIAAGGVYLEADGSLSASSYASGFASTIYPGRTSPDVCGLVGNVPRAAYIMLPLQPGSAIDVDLAGGTHPDGDETDAADGWAAISGTSAAAPQIAGVCALIKQACPKLTPAEVRDVLTQTARDVTTGTGANGHVAGPGHDLATGHGLVDAHRAVLLAKLRCLRRPAPTPIGPTRPPIGPGTLAGPSPAGGAEEGQSLTDEDLDALEHVLLDEDRDLDL